MLEVIGAGFGRTGTLSLKLALETLGFGPCYHMFEVLKHPPHDQLWFDAMDGSLSDWNQIFDGFQSTVDWPSTFFWQELLRAYPDAKVILTRRDERVWYTSVRETIFKALNQHHDEKQSGFSEHRQMTRELILKRVFGDRSSDADHIRAIYRAHNDLVEATVPKDQLLVYQPGDGWAPLCRFLDVEIPESDYPHANSRDEYQAKFVAES